MPRKVVEVLIPLSANVTLFGDRVFEDEQVQLTSLEWPLIQCDRPYKKEKFGHRSRDTGRMPCEGSLG